MGLTSQSSRVRPWIIERPRLADLVEEVLNRRLTTVVAGPGFGKSTLLAAWADRVDALSYTVREADAELAVLARGLQNAWGSHLPSIQLGGWNATQDPEEQVVFADALAAAVAEGLRVLSARPSVLVIDDLHEIPAGSASARAVEGIVRQAPPEVHVVIGSRAKLPFPVERLRGRGEVLEVSAQMLAFTKKEIHQLLSAASLDPISLADPLSTLAGGWPVAVRLAAEVLSLTDEARRPNVLNSLTTADGPLFSYLADEVISAEPEAVRGLLRLVAPLEWFSADLSIALGAHDARRILADLSRRGVLVEPAEPPDRYRLHALARAFCLENLPLTEEDLEQVLRDAAAWYENNAMIDEALRALANLGDVVALTGFLERQGERIVNAGDAPMVLRAVDHVPEATRTAAVQLIHARALVAMADMDLAGSILDRLESSDRSTTSDAILAHVRWKQGRSEEALDLIYSILPEDLAPADRARLLHTKAELLHSSGNREDAKAAMRASIEAAAETSDHARLFSAFGTLGNFYSFEGDIEARDSHWERALAAAERSGSQKLIGRGRMHRAEIFALVYGRVEEGLIEADAALSAVDLWSDSPVAKRRMRGKMLYTRAQILYYMGRLDEAVRDASEARDLTSSGGHSQNPMIHVLLGHIHALRGNTTVARSEFDRALQISRQAGQGHEEINAEVGIASVSAQDDPHSAVARVRRAINELGDFNDGRLRSEAGWVELLAGDLEKAREIALVALEDARAGKRPALPLALELVALTSDPVDLGSLQEAASLCREFSDPIGEARATFAHALLSGSPDSREAAQVAQARLESLGVRVRGATVGLLAALPKVIDDRLEIRSLGTFSVVRGGRAMSSSDWGSRKSRDLLRILVARRGVSLHREVLMDLLWPGEDASKLSNRFSIELSRARSALDPDRRFSQDHFIRVYAEAIALDLNRVDVDLESFITLAERGLTMGKDNDERARSCLEQAASLYAGDFLEDEPYAEWATAAREEARTLFLRVERASAEIAARRGEHDAAARHLLRVLERDPYDEQANLQLVMASAAAGRYGESRRYYRIYLRRMEELSVEPLPYPEVR